MSYLRKHSKSIGTPPQSAPLDATQVPNSAGGYSYDVGPWKMLERFLILGTEGGSYYATEQKLTEGSVTCLDVCLKEDGPRTVKTVVEISDAGRAIKNEPALFALAYVMAHGSVEARREACNALSRVARTGTHLFHFAQMAQDMRGWGRVLKRAIQQWYESKDAERLAQQVIKYRQRDGWTHRDLLRVAHPFGEDSALLKWVLKGAESDELSPLIKAHALLQRTTDIKEASRLIREHGLTWESVPTELLKSPAIWDAPLEKMPITALIRNLGRMTSIELLKPLSEASKLVALRLTDEQLLKKGRVHPISVLNALRTYQRGHGEKGSLSWKAVPGIIGALEDAFYLAFKSIQSTGRNFYFGLDVSGSMSSPIAGTSLSCREGTAVMSMCSVRREPNCYVRGFTHKLVELPLTAHTSLNEAIGIVHRSDFGGTDCGLPMLDALDRKLDVDVFVVMTDSETWAGDVHPKQALDRYRQKTGRGAKLVVVGMMANKFSIADPKDGGMMDCVGFDTNTPSAISEFARL